MQSNDPAREIPARSKPDTGPARPDKVGQSGEGARSALEHLIRQQDAARQPPREEVQSPSP